MVNPRFAHGFVPSHRFPLRRPPAAVRPLMALVTAMSGVCSACVTPQTTWYPAAPARPKVFSIAMKPGFSRAPGGCGVTKILRFREI